ncbi:MAG: hypothetical protein AAFQ98_18560, partial [Bacteroidota bacterium]
MLVNYLRTGWRVLRRQSKFTLINLSGLAAGLMVSLFLFQYVWYERSFDQYHPQVDNLYRITSSHYTHQELDRELPKVPPALGPAMASSLPGVEQFVRFRKIFGAVALTTGDRTRNEDRLY